jgi:hypothetical protein
MNTMQKNSKAILQQAMEAYRVVRDVEDPKLSRHSAHSWRLGCQSYSPALLYTRNNLWYLFLLEAE